MLFIAATSPESAARSHTTRRHGKHGRIAQNARHRMNAHSRMIGHPHGHRFARLSRHHLIPQRALTTQEKTEIVQKIRQLAENPSQMIAHPGTNASDAITNSGSNASNGDDSVIAAEANSPDIQSQIAEAAKEERAEDNIDVSLDKYFKSRPGAESAEQSPAMAAALDPAMDAERQPDITLFDETDPSRAAQRSDVMAEIIDWIGTRYVFGGEDRAGIDCSAFTREVFSKSFGIDLPRTAFDQSQLGDPVNKSELQFGDLVFFKTAGYAPITHVGIYIGEGLFANAACSRGVTVASLESEYWSKHYVEARRIFSNSGTADANASSIGSALADGSN
ncbi:MAG TPA: NlpC/P60 family protein [Candidatus Kapabacteria bacterium]|nr:NlpC/P60 family protein [Candidatus Kapabacteria bacterium]